MANGIFLTDEVLHPKWRLFANLAGVSEDEYLVLSKGWLSQYKNWTGLKQMKCYGDATSIALDTVDKEQLRIQELIKRLGYKLCDIFNADETGLFYVYVISILSD